MRARPRPPRGPAAERSPARLVAAVILLAVGVSLLLLSLRMHRAGPGGQGWTRVNAQVTALRLVAPEGAADTPYQQPRRWEVSFSFPPDEGEPAPLTWQSPLRPSERDSVQDVESLEVGRTVRLWMDPAGTRVEPVDGSPGLVATLGGLMLLASAWIFTPWTPNWGQLSLGPRQSFLALFLLPLLVLGAVAHEAVFSVLTKWWLWQEVPARVTVNDLERQIMRRKGAHTHHVLRYTYTLGGRTYESERFGALPALTFPPVLAAMRQGAAARATMCRVHPWDPAHAELQSGPGGSGLFMLGLVWLWLQLCRQLHLRRVYGPRKFDLALRARRRVSLSAFSLPRRAWMRFVWWLDPFWEFGQKSPATPEKDGAARWTQPGS